MNKTKALVFFGVLLVGLVISLVVLRKHSSAPGEFPQQSADASRLSSSQGRSAPPETGGQPADSSSRAPSADHQDKGGKQKADSPPGGKATGASKDPGQNKGKGESGAFSSPEALMSSLADTIRSDDYEKFTALVGEKTIGEAAARELKALLEDESLALDPERPVFEHSKSAESLRWAIRFQPVDGDGSEARQIFVDLVQGENQSLSIEKISLSLSIADAAKLASRSGETKMESSSTPATDANRSEGKPADSGKDRKNTPPSASPGDKPYFSGPDALTIADAFSRAVVEKEFDAARALSDPDAVTDERLAALLYAVEEGRFQLKRDRPLVVTLSRDDLAWVLARVQAGDADQGSEFALELGLVDGQWRINGLTFSKVIASLANRAGAGDVAYAPIVEDPEGGDSLVVYFEFDGTGVSSRANRQLAIIADILKNHRDRKIRINGHADAVGSDAYNVQLSDQRAASVRQALRQLGVSDRQIVTEAFGASRPRSPNFKEDGSDNPNGRSRNRRAEVYLDF